MKIADSPLSQTQVTFTIKPVDSGMPSTPSNTISTNIKETEGRIRFKGEGEGRISICVRISEMPGKKYIKPALIGFRVTETGESEEEDKPAAADMTPEQKETQRNAKNHLTEMERILNKMIRDANLLFKNADLIQTDESNFQRQSEEMNAASRWWPMLHVIVLLVMGFTQSNHVVKFFKGKHII